MLIVGGISPHEHILPKSDLHREGFIGRRLCLYSIICMYKNSASLLLPNLQKRICTHAWGIQHCLGNSHTAWFEGV